MQFFSRLLTESTEIDLHVNKLTVDQRFEFDSNFFFAKQLKIDSMID